ncbi:unnamed protein product [marine sediment metagenome]|uniref:Uncharacterized protein n=1 Tax=marine sediment metagenome TaxID=412755 RepID=X1N2U7_9ZZZZ
MKKWDYFTPLRDGERRIPLLRSQIFEINEGKDVMTVMWERYNKLRNEMFAKLEYRVNKIGEKVRPIVEKNLPIRISGRLTEWLEKPR